MLVELLHYISNILLCYVNGLLYMKGTAQELDYVILMQFHSITLSEFRYITL